MLGFECKDPLVVVDDTWMGRAIDVQVGDVILLPSSTAFKGSVVEEIPGNSSALVVRAAKPGIGRFVIRDTKWAQFVRVSRKQYSGLARYRHREEVEDE